jgi:hypothetical protein
MLGGILIILILSAMKLRMKRARLKILQVNILVLKAISSTFIIQTMILWTTMPMLLVSKLKVSTTYYAMFCEHHIRL